MNPSKLAKALVALAVVGAALVVAGVAMVSVPAALIVGGLYLLGGSLLALRMDV